MLNLMEIALAYAEAGEDLPCELQQDLEASMVLVSEDRAMLWH